MSTNFEGKQFIDAANEILKIDNLTEELVRTSVGRFYYGAFLEARDSAGITNTSGSVHEEVIKHYSRKDQSISNRLADLKKQRGMADYDLSVAVKERDAQKARRLANRILKSLGIGQ